MQHSDRAGELEVDHFDPRQKNNPIQDYRNLFPASRLCNGKKWQHWPPAAEEGAGIRFLNPCEEMDYGEQIFEAADAHQLFGVTPAARWHIRVCGLNSRCLVLERETRARYWALIEKAGKSIETAPDQVKAVWEAFRAEVELMIPGIPEE